MIAGQKKRPSRGWAILNEARPQNEVLLKQTRREQPTRHISCARQFHFNGSGPEKVLVQSFESFFFLPEALLSLALLIL